MIELQVHDVLWCAQHGHPVLTMQLMGSDRYFAVSMSHDDAAALAPHPSQPTAAGRARLYRLLESSITGLGARLTEVQLFVGDDGVLGAVARVAGPRGDLTLPVHFADGIALAHRRRVPLRMSEDDVDRVPAGPAGTPRAARDAQGHVHLTPYREVIESLDLDDFG